METIVEAIEHTEWLLNQIEAVQQNLEQLHSKLCACEEGLRGTLTELRTKKDTGSPVPARAEVRPSAEASAEATPAQGARGRERRTSPRRKGNPVAVRVSNPKFEGWVIDRSPDGLSLLADSRIEVGTFLSLCPGEQGATARVYLVEVRSCRAQGKNWIVGCRFTHKLAWKDLRLFG